MPRSASNARSNALLGLGLVAFGVLAGLPSMAAAQQRVVVERIRGPRGSAVRSALVRDLERNGVTVIESSEARAQRRELGFGRSLDAEQYVELARALNAAAIISGRVSRRRRRWSVRIRVRNGGSGEELGNEAWGGRTRASLSGVGRSGYQRLSQYLEGASAPGAAAPELAEGETPWYQRREVEEVEEAPPGGDEEDEPSAPREPSTRYDAFRILVGGGTLFRSMSTPVTVYAAQRNRMPADPASELISEDRRYQSGGIGHFELGGAVEFYPGAFDDQPFPYLGVVASFSHSIGVQSNGLNRMTGEIISVPTEQFDFYVGARGRYRFGADRREPTLYIDAGYGAFQFNLGVDQLRQIELDTIIPPMSHGYVHLGLGLRYGVVPTYLTLGLEAAGRIGTNIGGTTRNVWGINTAPSNGFLIAAEARVEIPEVVEGFFVALRLEYFQMITDFQGQVGCDTEGGCAGYMNPWEDSRLWEVWPVPAPPPGMGADTLNAIGGPQGAVTDHYFRLELQVGYAFR
ncbi:MAG: hypothetical protein AB8I08_33105 [Sandaracinaceae bacterium]